MDREEFLAFHRENRGKIRVEGKVPLESLEDLQRAYTPGVAAPAEEIRDDPTKVYAYTSKGEMVGVVSNGSATLGMGDAGPEAVLPIIEGKCLLIRKLAGISAFPVVLDEEDEGSMRDITEKLHPMFGFIMLEDIASPQCFQIEEELKEHMDVPVFHDDQHGAAIATLAGLKNALAVVDKELEDARIAVIGAGAAGIATTKLLMAAGADDIVVVDRPGILAPGMEEINWAQQEIAERTNPEGETGSLAGALEGADVMIGLSVGGIVSKEMIRSMADDPVVFALANPEPEIIPDDARDAGASVVGTGNPAYENEVNNVLAFPGIARGCLRCYARNINTEMKLAAANALAEMVEEPDAHSILPSPLDRRVADAVADAVSEAGRETGECRKH
jgi:malate dehydrogenase (oxaloacetate-decarboxylating)